MVTVILVPVYHNRRANASSRTDWTACISSWIHKLLLLLILFHLPDNFGNLSAFTELVSVWDQVTHTWNRKKQLYAAGGLGRDRAGISSPSNLQQSLRHKVKHCCSTQTGHAPHSLTHQGSEIRRNKKVSWQWLVSTLQIVSTQSLELLLL